MTHLQLKIRAGTGVGVGEGEEEEGAGAGAEASDVAKASCSCPWLSQLSAQQQWAQDTEDREDKTGQDSPQLEQWQKSLPGILNRHRRRRKTEAGEGTGAAGTANDPRIGSQIPASCQHMQPYSTQSFA